MSVLKSMYAAASGLLAHSEAISVASDNIANVNTVGFKTQRARFEDVLGAVLGQPQGKAVRGVDAFDREANDLLTARVHDDTVALAADGQHGLDHAHVVKHLERTRLDVGGTRLRVRLGVGR